MPLVGQGTSNTTFSELPSRLGCIEIHLFSLSENLECTDYLDVKLVERNGKEYLNIEKIRVTMHISRMILDMKSDLSEEISRPIGQMLNDNWKDLFNEIKPDVEVNIAEVLKTTLQEIFAIIPYKDFFVN